MSRIRVIRLAAAVWMCAAAETYLALPATAETLFQDGFEDDAVGTVPVIGGNNVGESWDLFVPVPPDGEALAQVHDDNAGGNPEGDYNDGGTVDAGDFVVWRDNAGAEASLPNDLLGGTIGQDHYEQWKNNFGAEGPEGDFVGVPSHPDSGSQYLALHRIFSASPIATGDFLGSSISSGEVTLSFEAYVKSGGGRGQVFLSDGTNTGTFDRLVNLFFEDGAVLEFNGSSVETVSGLSFTADQWQHVEISLDLDDQTYSVDVEHGASTGGGTFLDDAVTAGRELGALHLSAAVNGAVFFVDDVSLDTPDVSATQNGAMVPEPASVMMAAAWIVVGLLVRGRSTS